MTPRACWAAYSANGPASGSEKEPASKQEVESTEECGDLYMPDTGSGTIKRCGVVGVGVALLEEVCHCGGGL